MGKEKKRLEANKHFLIRLIPQNYVQCLSLTEHNRAAGDTTDRKVHKSTGKNRA